uniref:Uncharacterized protein n=1 Tax=Octopus bimaculoides TaxID=37653 RepID=A0A0L8H9P2_OCTBM
MVVVIVVVVVMVVVVVVVVVVVRVVVVVVAVGVIVVVVVITVVVVVVVLLVPAKMFFQLREQVVVTGCQVQIIRWVGNNVLFMVFGEHSWNPSCAHLPILQLFTQNPMSGASGNFRNQNVEIIQSDPQIFMQDFLNFHDCLVGN